MNDYLQMITRRMLVLSILLLCATWGWSQVYQNGVRTGMVKVKFTTDMSAPLSQMRVQSGKKLVTGIQAFDAVATQTAAKNMYRLFPYDPRFENKLRKHGLHLWYVVEIDEKTNPKTAVAQFKQLKEVAIAEAEREKTLEPYKVSTYSPQASTFSTLPFNDPYLKDQWHYDNTGQSGFADADINLFEAWKQTTGANNIIVSVHDEGIDVNHNDLKANIWTNEAEANGAPGVDDDNNGYVDDVHGYNFQKNKGAVDAQSHGTHVAGTIAAVNNNGIGVSGIAGGNGSGNGVKVMSLQIFGGAFENSYIYAANNGAVISQNSWGYSNPGSYDQSVLDAIDYFITEAGDYPGSPMKGGLVIFASGNSNSNADWYPGYHENVLSVSSLGPEWKRAYYSNYGEWVEISAPGGDQEYGANNGVLSTAPKNQYAYMQGTSMACPHVSGIAALALANRDKQLTNLELWNKLVTGVVDVYQYNPEFIGELGSGAIDADLAIRNNKGLAPQAISNLTVKDVAQEFAILSWKIPVDEDDGKPSSFTLYYHTQPITLANLSSASKVTIKNNGTAGEEFVYELSNLLGMTAYHFVATSTDRWGNVSNLSNVATATTNAGPSIAVDENSQLIEMTIDAGVSMSDTHTMTILNNAAGVLRWDHFFRHKNTELSFNAAGLHYPTVTLKKLPGEAKVMRTNAHYIKNKIRSNEPQPMAFTSIEKSYSSWPTNIIGETDLKLTNSAGARFFVNEPEGFNLTQVRMYLKHNPDLGPVIVEIYKGAAPVKENLLYAQEYSSYNDEEVYAYVTLNEQLYFESGSTFWVVFHVPAGNRYPLGIGYEDEPSNSANCFMSFDMGSTWAPLEELLESEDFAWTMTAASMNPYLGTYLTLEPGSGDVSGNQQTETWLSADGSALINGSYSANLVLTSNDANQRELRVPVQLTVSGHQPKLKNIDIVDFGSVFKGTSKSIEIVLENVGFGNFNNPSFTIDNNQFVIDGSSPWQIKAREEVVVKIKFLPASSGNINGTLNITNGDQTYAISLFGVGAETSQIKITPEIQLVDNVAIGDEINAQVTVENTGAYPLKYFIPGYDTKGVSENWPADYHNYGYRFRTSYASESNPIAYEFQDISSTGTNITEPLKDDGVYVEVDMGFDFPYYGHAQQKIYIAQKGFTTFDNSVRPINTPSLNNTYNPKGFISILGSYFDFVSPEGSIYYQVEADRVIIQYNNVWDGWHPEFITAQIVLFANGNIRFFYDNMGYSADNQKALTILIENLDQNDGIQVHGWNKPLELYSGLALGFDYPGPNIIQHVENGSGIVPPGGSAIVDISLVTETLSESLVNRYINFVCNEPANPQASALIQLNVNKGGKAKPIVTPDTIAFGNVFQGANRSASFIIKNNGTANVNIASMNLIDGEFNFTGSAATIAPGMYKKCDVNIPTGSLADLEDWISINYTDGTHDTVYITGTVVVPPAITVDLSLLQQTLAFGEKTSHPFEISNPGLAPLEVSFMGNQWLSFETSEGVAKHDYSFIKNNDGEFYQWIDIRRTGEQLPFLDFDDYEGTFWRTLDLPFPIQFYGEEFTSFKIGDNGIISFEETPEPSFYTDHIPTEMHPGKCIMPYWTFSGFSDMLYPMEDIGIFYKAFDDKFIITWSYFTNNFGGMGDPVSAQVIFYKDGTMKFQYKKEEGGADLTSQNTSIGLQENSENGLALSEYHSLDFGQGLAYIIVPTRKYVVAPGTTLVGEIKIDATQVYGGVYNGALKIQNNVPNSESLEKPVELTVTGEAVVSSAESVDFGNKMIDFEFGSPIKNYLDFNISNAGSASFDLSWAQMADGTQNLSLEIWMLADGWFGPEWRWVDISEAYSLWAFETPVFTIKPGDNLKARASFAPATAGSFADELVLTTTAGEIRAAFSGSAVEPPVLGLDTTSIKVVMTTPNETKESTIAFDNLMGASDLAYEISIDYKRVITSTSSEKMATSRQQAVSVKAIETKRFNVSQPMATYNRILTHTAENQPGTYVGTGGASPFTIATKYNGGSEGFYVSHVEVWFRTEALTEGNITAQIRAGGNSIATALTLGEGTLEFTGSGEDEVGAWYTVALSEPVGIYPNEDFYVVVEHPFGIDYPQGTVTNEESIAGRYFYEDASEWFDAQEVPGFENFGWLMYVGEQAPHDFSWVSVKSATSGSLAAGESSVIELLIDGNKTLRGDQAANVVIRSNDPKHEAGEVSVSLHMNEAPKFLNVPVEVVVAENEPKTITMMIADPEKDAFTLSTAAAYEDIEYILDGSSLRVTLSPEFGDAGNYSYTFVATDVLGAIRELVLSVEVTHTNRAPVFIATERTFNYHATGSLTEFSIDEFFSDPDNDAVTFTVISSNPSVEVFASVDGFMIRPVSLGEADLQFQVTDVHNATTVESIKVVVNAVLALEEDQNQGVKVYPNAVQKFVNVSFSNKWNGNLAVEVVDAAGRSQLSTSVDARANTQLDLSVLKKGFYVLRVSDGEKQKAVKIVKE